MRHLDLALLRSFVAVADTGSPTRAAERVHLTQAAVSQQIRRLEEALGLLLFDRDRRRLELTSQGERLLVHARRMLALNDDVWSAMVTPEHDGEVFIGVPHDLASPILPPVLRRFRTAWPRVRITLSSTTTPRLKQAYAEKRIEMCLTTELTTPPGAELLYPDALIWVGAEGGEAWLRRPLPIALGDTTCAFREPMLRALDEAGCDWRLANETIDMTSLFACVEADLGITAVLRGTLPPKLEPVPDGAGLPALPPFNVNLYPPPAQAGRAAHELADHIRRGLRPGLADLAA